MGDLEVVFYFLLFIHPVIISLILLEIAIWLNKKYKNSDRTNIKKICKAFLIASAILLGVVGFVYVCLIIFAYNESRRM